MSAPQESYHNPPTSTPDDPFDTLLSLEDQYHTEGYNSGYADGSKAGRIEGRLFGLENGFEKFVEMGRLGGQAAVWDARLPSTSTPPSLEANKMNLKLLSGSERLAKHVRRLRELTEPEDLPTENSEDAVQSFDEALKDAKGKVTLISKIVGEDGDVRSGASGSTTANGVGRGMRVKRDENGKGSGEMEDFAGMRVGGSK